jgi:hypothetical protein
MAREGEAAGAHPLVQLREGPVAVVVADEADLQQDRARAPQHLGRAGADLVLGALDVDLEQRDGLAGDDLVDGPRLDLDDPLELLPAAVGVRPRRVERAVDVGAGQVERARTAGTLVADADLVVAVAQQAPDDRGAWCARSACRSQSACRPCHSPPQRQHARRAGAGRDDPPPPAQDEKGRGPDLAAIRQRIESIFFSAKTSRTRTPLRPRTAPTARPPGLPLRRAGRRHRAQHRLGRPSRPSRPLACHTH